MIKTITLFALIILTAVFSANAAPKSPAPFAKARQDAEMVMYHSAECELISHNVAEHNGTSLGTSAVSNSSMNPLPITSDRIGGTGCGVFHSSGVPSGDVYPSNGQPNHFQQRSAKYFN